MPARCLRRLATLRRGRDTASVPVGSARSGDGTRRSQAAHDRRVNKPAFLNYLRGVISSVAYGIIRKSGFRAEHKPWDDDRPGTAAPGNSPEQNAELNEFRYQFFQRLRKRAPERLLSTIDAWESVFTETDRIPAPSRREYVAEVRNLAKEVISEIEGIN